MSQEAGGPAAPGDRIDPARSVCVLIGVDDYAHLDPLRSVRHNLAGLRAALTDPEIWGIADDRVVVVGNPRDAAALTGPVREAAERAEDTLLVYYAGHGLVDRHERQLHLTLPHSEEDRPETCVRSADVRRAIRDQGAARRRVLLIDCCFSGQVVTEMTPSDPGGQGSAAAVRTLKGVEGAYVMTSAARDRPAHAPDPKRPTVFTGALVDVLRAGVPDGPGLLSLHDVFLAVRARIASLRPEVPQEPQDQSSNGVGDLPFVRNRAVLPALSPPPPAAPGPARRRLLGCAAAALAVGLLAGFGLRPLVAEGWDRLFPAAPQGRCSAGASLLDHSDALDKKQDNYEPVQGLSALGLRGTEGADTAIAVADNEPGRYFTLRLGAADALDVEVRGARTLTRADGGAFPSWYDAEGLAIEKGGRTMLISSEADPSIRRFDIATGRQISEDFPIPKPLRYWPEGSAQMGRSIESLTLSPDGRYLYAGWEAPLASDGDTRGRGLLRIQRYRGTPGGTYTPDRQYAYMASDGLSLVDLAAVDEHRLLALERQYTAGLGNAIKVVRIDLRGAGDVTGRKSLFRLPSESFVRGSVLFDLAACPSGGPGQVARPAGKVGNALVDNVEGMALGEPWTSGPHRGSRPLYLLSDDNGSQQQVTRVYGLAVEV
ncbi:caspase, EACC1-associated type [Streptomyces sp. CA-253872]|uniref:caspase, EACC1-associated type n=1 Tax=Streptomyces sp. CA-253872 TaxID=3240067 RepID=UPI003D92FCB1